MKVSDQIPEVSVEAHNPVNGPNSAQRVSTASSTASTVENTSSAAETAIVTPAQRQADITFRRDSNGRIYYVVSDAKSGEEIMEVPSQSVRDVDQGIAEYLQQAESRAGAHVKLKA